jgi:hypothetical protein
MLHFSARVSSACIAALVLLTASAAFAKNKDKDSDKGEPALTAPEPDSMGRVHFGPATGEGLGRVTVKAPASEGVRVFLDGRYFGRAPLTIYSVPKGDYIVEGQYSDGKSQSRPVSVSENEEQTVELTGPKAEGAGEGGAKQGVFSGEISPQRLQVTKILLLTGGVALVFGVTFGILEMRDESNYNSATNQQDRDNITTRGKRDAALANVGYILAGASLIGAAIAGYPLVVKPTAEKPMALMVMPVAAPGLTGGALSLRF